MDAIQPLTQRTLTQPVFVEREAPQAAKPVTAPEPAARRETATPVDPTDRAERARQQEERRRPRQPAYRVDIDPDTRRLFTEVLNPVTGGVLLRIPAQAAAPAGQGGAPLAPQPQLDRQPLPQPAADPRGGFLL